MDTKERARLRALREDVSLPLRAERTEYVVELVDAADQCIGTVETEHSDDDEWCDEVHADLIVGAVNALGPLLDDADAAEARATAAERERDEARAEAERLRTAAQDLLDADELVPAGTFDSVEAVNRYARKVLARKALAALIEGSEDR